MLYDLPTMKQLSLIKAEKPVHGGDLNLGKRKTLRPLARQRPIHLVLKAKESFPGDDGAIVLKEAQRIAEKFGVKIFDHAVGNDHLHLLITIPGRGEYNAFIRTLSGLLARRFGKGYWKQAPFTRVASWGREFRVLEKYLEKNRLEAAGLLPYRDRWFTPNWV